MHAPCFLSACGGRWRPLLAVDGRHVDVGGPRSHSNLALAEGEVYSQPANTGVGVHESTQLVAAIDALKVRTNGSL